MGAPQLDSQSAGQSHGMADGEPFEISKALATAEDAEHRNQKEVPRRDADATAHPSVRSGAQEADQVKIGCGSLRFEHREGAMPPTAPPAEASGQDTWDTL
jgi:hypothetical protein